MPLKTSPYRLSQPHDPTDPNNLELTNQPGNIGGQWSSHHRLLRRQVRRP